MKKTQITVAACVLVALPAFAADRFAMQNVRLTPSHSEFEMQYYRYTASCGPAEVTYRAAMKDDEGKPLLTFDSRAEPMLVMRNGARSVAVQNSQLNNGGAILRCVDTKAGKRLVLLATCGGTSGCDPDEYTVMDTQTLKRVGGPACTDLGCVEKVLGIKLGD